MVVLCTLARLATSSIENPYPSSDNSTMTVSSTATSTAAPRRWVGRESGGTGEHLGGERLVHRDEAPWGRAGQHLLERRDEAAGETLAVDELARACVETAQLESVTAVEQSRHAESAEPLEGRAGHDVGDRGADDLGLATFQAELDGEPLADGQRAVEGADERVPARPRADRMAALGELDTRTSMRDECRWLSVLRSAR